MNYYRVLHDGADEQFPVANLRVNDEPFDPREFTYGQMVAAPAGLELERPEGAIIPDWTFSEFSMPVVREQLAQRIAAACPNCVQLVPVTVRGVREGFRIFNATAVVDCFDHKRSIYTRRPEPSGLGEIRLVAKIVVVAARALGTSIFRIKGWPVALIVDEIVHAILHGSTGIKFEPLEAV